jgi:hypothetical protein
MRQHIKAEVRGRAKNSSHDQKANRETAPHSLLGSESEVFPRGSCADQQMVLFWEILETRRWRLAGGKRSLDSGC